MDKLKKITVISLLLSMIGCSSLPGIKGALEQSCPATKTQEGEIVNGKIDSSVDKIVEAITNGEGSEFVLYLESANNTPPPKPAKEEILEMIENSYDITWPLRDKLKNFITEYIKTNYNNVNVVDFDKCKADSLPDVEGVCREVWFEDGGYVYTIGLITGKDGKIYITDIKKEDEN